MLFMAWVWHDEGVVNQRLILSELDLALALLCHLDLLEHMHGCERCERLLDAKIECTVSEILDPLLFLKFEMECLIQLFQLLDVLEEELEGEGFFTVKFADLTGSSGRLADQIL